MRNRLRKFLNRISALSYVIRRHWSIGIFHGTSPVNFFPINKNSGQVLTANDVTDIQASFVADPFIIKENGKWYMFFEVLNTKLNKGEIGFATSSDGTTWNYEKLIISEKYHLSFPFVFKWNSEYYMIPETRSNKSVQLYKAINFPTNWEFTSTLLQGDYFDSSVFYYNNKWWLFTSKGNDDTLILFYSDELKGPWVMHPENPIVKENPHIARQAGRVQLFGGKIIRYAQDDYPLYGTQVYAFEIMELTPTTYKEEIAKEDPILKPSGRGWNALGMHHIDPLKIGENEWIACVDGWDGYVKVKYPIRKKLLKKLSCIIRD